MAKTHLVIGNEIFTLEAYNRLICLQISLNQPANEFFGLQPRQLVMEIVKGEAMD